MAKNCAAGVLAALVSATLGADYAFSFSPFSISCPTAPQAAPEAEKPLVQEPARVRNDNPRTSAACFHPEALERGAEASRKINSSENLEKNFEATGTRQQGIMALAAVGAITALAAGVYTTRGARVFWRYPWSGLLSRLVTISHRGLDCALMTRGGVAPQCYHAFTKIHPLFDWAKMSNKGLLLSMDQADVFLCKRNKAYASEAQRGARNALLYQTSGQWNSILTIRGQKTIAFGMSRNFSTYRDILKVCENAVEKLSALIAPDTTLKGAFIGFIIVSSSLRCFWDLFRLVKYQKEKKVVVGKPDTGAIWRRVITNGIFSLTIIMSVDLAYKMKLITGDEVGQNQMYLIASIGTTILLSGVIMEGILAPHFAICVDMEHQRNVTQFKHSTYTTAILVVLGYIAPVYFLVPLEQSTKSVLAVGGTIGGVVSAFGSRHIMENLLSGVYITIFCPFVIGSDIKVDKVEGKVVVINWSTTTVRDSKDLLVAVPNSALIGQPITNKSMAQWRKWDTDIPIHIDDLEKIPRLLGEMANVLKASSVLVDGDCPKCLIVKIHPSYVQISVSCKIKHEADDGDQVLITKILETIRENGIRIGGAAKKVHNRRVLRILKLKRRAGLIEDRATVKN